MALMCPKVESPEHLGVIAELLDTLEAARGLPAGHTRLVALVETADAYFRMREIAKATPRLVALSLGAEDFALSVGMEPIGRDAARPRSRPSSSPPAPPASCRWASWARWPTSRTSRPSARSCAARASSASPARTCIHPSVVHVLNEEYGVSPEAIDRARRMIAAYDEVIARGVGAVTFEGKMIDVPVVEREKALLRQAERLAARRPK